MPCRCGHRMEIGLYFTTEENKVCWIPADGSGAVTTISTGPDGYRVHPLAITPDGQTLIVSHQKAPNGQIDLWTLSVGPNPRLTPLLAEPSYNEHDARLSPDGRWLAYTSDESGQESNPGSVVSQRERRSRTSWATGSNQSGHRDSRELFYRTEDGQRDEGPLQDDAVICARHANPCRRGATDASKLVTRSKLRCVARRPPLPHDQGTRAGHPVAHGRPELGRRGEGNNCEGLPKVRFCDLGCCHRVVVAVLRFAAVAATPSPLNGQGLTGRTQAR